jgi:hypothetical protein
MDTNTPHRNTSNTSGDQRSATDQLREILSRRPVRSALLYAASILALMVWWVWFGAESLLTLSDAIAKASPEGRQVAVEALGMLALGAVLIGGTVGRLLNRRHTWDS